MILEREVELFDQGVQLFNRKEFYECDQIMCDLLWQAPAADKGFYQGLIEIAGAFFHWTERRYEGFFTLLSAGIENLTSYPPLYKGLDLGRFIKQVHDFREAFGEQLKTGHANAPVLEIPKLAYRGQ